MGLAMPYFAAKRLSPEPEAPGCARRFTRQTLSSWGAEADPDIVTVANELVTNAVRHAFTNASDADVAWLGLSTTPSNVLCAVTDPSPTPPRLLPPSPLSAQGRGLHVIDALSHSWGYTLLTDEPGKVVWAHVSLHQGTTDPDGH